MSFYIKRYDTRIRQARILAECYREGKTRIFSWCGTLVEVSLGFDEMQGCIGQGILQLLCSINRDFWIAVIRGHVVQDRKKARKVVRVAFVRLERVLALQRVA